MTTLLEGGRIGELVIILHASLGEVCKSSDREKACNRRAWCCWIVLRKLKVPANVREAELIEQPRAEHMGLTDRKVVVVDYLVASEQRAELRIADLGDISWPVSDIAKSQGVILCEFVIYPQSVVVDICRLIGGDVCEARLD